MHICVPYFSWIAPNVCVVEWVGLLSFPLEELDYGPQEVSHVCFADH